MLFPRHQYATLARAESALDQGLASALEALRALSHDEFAAATFGVPPEFLRLRQSLPRYAEAEIQRGWTGNDGVLLLQKTALFSRMLDGFYAQHAGKPLRGARILDYGCGWGRLLRQMLYFSDPDRLFGVDPWSRSIEECRKTNVLGAIHQIDYHPQALPDAIRSIDCAIAFSIFTHLGESNVREILTCVRKVMAPGGLFVATIRPVEYWAPRRGVLGEETVARMVAQHESGEYAFIPSGAVANAGSQDYGEASVSLEGMQRLGATAGWRVVGHDWLLLDPFQLLICLQVV
jgi:2-polyprenyl-3-methyl-5-hydroxy-6-metoxy-1,4-benzoquinol methylase